MYEIAAALDTSDRKVSEIRESSDDCASQEGIGGEEGQV